jgi:DNA-binding SARP family transcriptional activator/predicted RNA-binding Zn ribbon-like protein
LARTLAVEQPRPIVAGRTHHRLTSGPANAEEAAGRPVSPGSRLTIASTAATDTLGTVMDFQLLGPFEARADGQPITVASRRQERLLLAVLLLEAGRIVSIDRLTDLLWDDQPPRSARAAIHTYVGRLRHTLAPHDVAIATHGDGYRFEPGGHRVDAVEFLDRAQHAATVLDQGERVRLLDAALGMWRGPLLADLADDELRHRLGAHLIEAGLSAWELLADIRLAMGHHDRVAADLTGPAEQNPMRERLVALLMTALYRGHRRAEAVELYQRTRKLLVTELGVEPGPDLRALHVRILRHDPSLDRPPMPAYAVRVRDQWLPWKAAGHPALEFCNTYAAWNAGPSPRAEWLRSYQVLAVWAEYVDLADQRTVTRLLDEAGHDPLHAAAVLEDARTLRRHLYACLTRPDATEAFDIVARYAEEAAKQSQFRRDSDRLGRWQIADTAGLGLPLHAAARTAADLLADPRHLTVRRCPAVDCGWLYLDQSGLRQWCTMALCAPPGQRHPDATRALCG